MQEEPTPRLVGFRNSRDLGGWETAGGSRTVFGRVIRSDTPAVLTPGELSAAHRAGLALVVDLRSTRETEAAPHPLTGFAGYRHRPLIDERTAALDAADRAASLGEVYRVSLTRNAATIAAVLATIAGGPPGPLLVCCTAGKDRTGMIAALLLRLAGVTRQAIGADYALSGPIAADPTAVTAADSRAGTSTRLDPRSCAPEHIHQLIDHLDGHFGGPRPYLEQLGLTPREIDTLTRRLT